MSPITEDRQCNPIIGQWASHDQVYLQIERSDTIAQVQGHIAFYFFINYK